MSEPRILYLSPEHPDPEGNGGEVRLFRILRELGRKGWDITVVAPATKEKIARGRVLAEFGIKLRSVQRPQSPAREAVEAILEDPRIAIKLFSRSWMAWQAEVFRHEMRSVLENVMGETWDAAIIEHDWAIGWSEMLPDGLPVGLVFQNVTEELLGLQAASAASRVDRWRAQRDALLVRNEVSSRASRLTRAFACSAEDAETIVRRWSVTADVVPNGTDTAKLAKIDHSSEVAGRIVFTGTMSYPPNAQAAEWFVREVLPLVRREYPGVTMQIVGGGVGRETELLGEVAGVEVTGRVQSLSPYLAGASVVVAPLLSGGGTKLKVLEALAAGRALVATRVAAEGIEVVDSEHLRIEDEAEAFAAATVDLLRHPRFAHAIGEGGRRQVATRYDWVAVGDRMDAALRDWLAA